MTTEFVWKAIDKLELSYIAESHGDVVMAMTFGPDEPHDFHRFLGKFAILDHIRWTPDLLRESICAICEQLFIQQIDHAWIRFSIQKYLTYIRWHRWELIQFVYKCFDEFAPGRVGLVLSLKYESPRANQKHMADLIRDKRVSDYVMGIDVVGDEAYYSAPFYAEILQPWKDAKKLLFAHVGESQPACNVMTAMKDVGITEICHGIKAVNNIDILKYAVDHNVCFHMALTSNLLTGVVPNLSRHPLPIFINNGVLATIGTDDPVQCSTTLSAEYKLAHDLFGPSVVSILKANAASRYLKSL